MAIGDCGYLFSAMVFVVGLVIEHGGVVVGLSLGSWQGSSLASVPVMDIV